MRWYKPLYMGGQAAKKRFSLIQGLRRKKLCMGAYVITPASGGNNILDIYPAAELLLPYYRDKDFLIMGIAVGYEEATELASRIVTDLYCKTGSFHLNELLGDETP